MDRMLVLILRMIHHIMKNSMIIIIVQIIMDMEEVETTGVEVEVMVEITWEEVEDVVET